MSRVGPAGGGNETTTRIESAVGARLRSAREARKLTDEAASAQSHVPLRYLRMLEAGSFPTVADPAYLTHFLRRYAAFLGLDAEASARDFLHETEPETAARLSGRKPPESPRRRPRRLPPGWAIYGTVLVIVLGGVYSFVRFQQKKEAATREIASLDPRPSASSGLREALRPTVRAEAPASASPPAAVAPPSGGAVARKAEVKPAERTSDTSPASVRPAKSAEPTTSPAVSLDEQPARAPEGQASGQARSAPDAGPREEEAVVAAAPVSAPASGSPAADADGEAVDEAVEAPFELVLTATSRQVWIWVSIDGGPRQAISLREGESVAFRAEERYVLSVDDAGGIDATLNGESLPSFGGSAQARRNVVIPSSEFGGRPGRG